MKTERNEAIAFAANDIVDKLLSMKSDEERKDVLELVQVSVCLTCGDTYLPSRLFWQLCCCKRGRLKTATP